jgi:L-threonylcarbamoyladenylate synthase
MSRSGCTRVFGLKGRSEAKALLVLYAAREQLGALGAAAPPQVLDRFFGLWPAPLTVVLPLRVPIPASAGEATLGVRVPAHEPLRRLLAQVGPVTGTSLNRSGEPPPTDPDEVERAFGRDLDVLVDGGRTPGGLPSTLVDATFDPPRLIRAGAFPWPPEAA